MTNTAPACTVTAWKATRSSRASHEVVAQIKLVFLDGMKPGGSRGTESELARMSRHLDTVSRHEH